MTSKSWPNCQLTPLGKNPPRLWKTMGVGLVLVVASLVGLLIIFIPLGGGLPEPSIVLKPRGLSVNHLCFSPDGRYLLVASPKMSAVNDARYFEAELAVFDLTTNEKFTSVMLPQWVRSLSFDLKADILAVVIGSPTSTGVPATDGMPREVRLYSFPGLKQKGKIDSKRYINNAALSPDGKLLVTASKKDVALPGEIKIWDADLLNLKCTVEGDSFLVTQIRFATDGKSFAINDRNPGVGKAPFDVACVRQFNAVDGKNLATISSTKTEAIEGFYFLPGGNKVILNQRGITVMDIGTGKEINLPDGERFSHLRTRITAVSPDGKWIAIALNLEDRKNTRDVAKMMFWDVEAERMHAEWIFKDEPSGATCIAFSPDSKKIGIGADKIYIYDFPGK